MASAPCSASDINYVPVVSIAPPDEVQPSCISSYDIVMLILVCYVSLSGRVDRRCQAPNESPDLQLTGILSLAFCHALTSVFKCSSPRCCYHCYLKRLHWQPRSHGQPDVRGQCTRTRRALTLVSVASGCSAVALRVQSVQLEVLSTAVVLLPLPA